MMRIAVVFASILALHTGICKAQTDDVNSRLDSLSAQVATLSSQLSDANTQIQDLTNRLNLLDSKEQQTAAAVTDLRNQAATATRNNDNGDTNLNAQLQQPADIVALAKQGGVVYTRWGKNGCPLYTTQLYQGYVMSSHYAQKYANKSISLEMGGAGGGSNYMCVHSSPQWSNVQTGFSSNSALLFPAKYDMNTPPFDLTSAPVYSVAACSVCYTDARVVQVMIPGRTDCPNNWMLEYGGWLVATKHDYMRTEFICMDGTPEAAPIGTQANLAAAWIHSVELDRCEDSSCDVYPDGNEVSCVVCTK